MMIRKHSATGDYVFGRGPGAFITGAPAVAQLVRSRLTLHRGEWFLDDTAGVSWIEQADGAQSILGARPSPAFIEAEIKRVILQTEGVTSIVTFQIDIDKNTRRAGIYASVTTEDGNIEDIEVPVL